MYKVTQTTKVKKIVARQNNVAVEAHGLCFLKGRILEYAEAIL